MTLNFLLYEKSLHLNLNCCLKYYRFWIEYIWLTWIIVALRKIGGSIVASVLVSGFLHSHSRYKFIQFLKQTKPTNQTKSIDLDNIFYSYIEMLTIFSKVPHSRNQQWETLVPCHAISCTYSNLSMQWYKALFEGAKNGKLPVILLFSIIAYYASTYLKLLCSSNWNCLPRIPRLGVFMYCQNALFSKSSWKV